MPEQIPFDALMPSEMAGKTEYVGVSKAQLNSFGTFALAVLAGTFIAMGAVFATTATTGGSAMPFGVTRVFGGLTFSLGLILVVVAGAELFTGNNLIIMAWASRKVTTMVLLRSWIIVYFCNFIPIGLFIKSGASADFWTQIGMTAADFPNLT